MLNLASESARLKLIRADYHLRDLNAAIAGWLGSRPYTFTDYPHPDRLGETVRRIEPTKPPARIALVFGDYVNALRAALDHVVFDLCGRPANDKTGFPIFCVRTPGPFVGRHRKGYVQEAPKLLRGVGQQAQQFIEGRQPYHWADFAGRHPLWVLSELVNADKHRAIPVILSAARDTNRLIGETEKAADQPQWVEFAATGMDEGYPSFPADRERDLPPHVAVQVLLGGDTDWAFRDLRLIASELQNEVEFTVDRLQRMVE